VNVLQEFTFLGVMAAYRMPYSDSHNNYDEMRRFSMFQRLSLTVLLILVGLLTACGGGGGASSSSGTAGKTGSVGLLLTDAPADPSLFSEINVTIERVELIGGDGGRVSLFDGPAETVDLLKLRNESVPFTFRDDVPVGTYCKVRLTLARPDGLELVLAADSSSNFPKLPGNGKLDLLARDCFTVAPGASVTLQLDMDAGNSIHIVQTGSKTEYNFRPVVFIDVINDSFTGKLVRLEGVIADYDAVDQTLLLCNALPTHDSRRADCASVELGPDSAFFDNLTLEGAAAPLSNLLIDTNLGQPAAAVGLVSGLVTGLESPEVPADAWPGTGFCRLWDPEVEAASQPYPDDVVCDDPGLTVYAGWVLMNDQGVVEVDHRPRLILNGFAVETGSFAQVYATVATAVTAGRFDLSIADPRTVLLQQPAGFNGTRILSKSGDLLDESAIQVGRALKLDGVVLSTGELNAAVVIVDTDTLGVTAASGAIGSLTSSGFILVPEAGTTPCGVSGDLSVVMDADTTVTTVTIEPTLVDVSPGGLLEAGQSVAASGLCGAASLSADSVVVVEDLRP
jgi:hypothetical protein